jgi:hypothetical protein
MDLKNLTWETFPEWSATIHELPKIQSDVRAALDNGANVVCVPCVFKTYDETMEIKRHWGHAVCDFEDVEHLLFNGAVYTGKPFTKEFPLFIEFLQYTGMKLKIKPGVQTIKYTLLFFDKNLRPSVAAAPPCADNVRYKQGMLVW